MKKNILAIAIASAVAAPVAMADAPTIYGQFNTAIDSISIDGGATGMNVVSRNSRFGFKGAEDLGNGLKAVYQLETAINPTDVSQSWGNTGPTGIRNSFLGLAGGFGTVLMGRHDTPLRMIQPADGFADSAYAGNNTSNFNGKLAGEDRVDEVVAYLSPDFGGIKFAVAGTGQQNLEANDQAIDDQSITNATSMNVTYGSKKSGIFAAAGMTSGDAINDRTRATVQYKEAGLLASFMYNAEADAGNSMTLGAAYKMGALTPRAKVSMVSFEDGLGAEDSATNMAAGVDYALGKKTRAYAEYASLAEGYNRGNGSATTVMSVGLFHKF